MQIITRDNVELKKEIIQTKTQQQKTQMENAELNGKQQQIQTESNEKTNKINKIIEELKHAKRDYFPNS